MQVAPTDRARVVVISSGQPFLHLIQTLLDGQGLGVFTSQDWDTALALIGRIQADLLVLDLAPGHEPACWTTLDALAMSPAARALPVLVCPVATWLLEGSAAWLAHLVVRTWTAPFNPDELLREVEILLALRGAQEEHQATRAAA